LLALVFAVPAAAEYVAYKGHRVYYQVVGQGDPALVLVHGWACDSTVWRFNAPGLAKNHKLVLVDMPGHGQSDKPKKEYDFDFLAGGVAAAIKASGVKRPALAGHSLGATIGRQVIRRNPGMVSRLISVDGAFVSVPKDPKARAAWEKQSADRVAGFKKDFRSTMKPFVESMLGPAVTPELKMIILDKMMAADPHVAISEGQAMNDPRNWRPEAIETPTFAMYVEGPFTPPDFPERLKGLFPNVTYAQWQGAGHFFFMEKPAKFNKQVLEYLNE
jgi:pimeloyl-ACP methyl ester carboxylesterase